MSIFKQSFPKWIKEQLKLRQDLQATGINGGYKSNAALVWNNSRQCVVRASSLVDYKENLNLSISDGVNTEEFEKLKGNQLAKKFILQGGILNNGQIRSTEFGRVGSAYGDHLLGANGGADGFGQVPMPGITGLDIATKSAYGSLRQAKLSFVVHNLRQLEIMELLYLRPGYPILVEWQWSPFINNSGEIDSLEYIVDDNIIFPKGNGKVKQEDIYDKITNLKKETQGNYDGFLGFVTNFGFQAREDGGFDCYSEIISMGEVLDSLKIPSSTAAFNRLFPNEDITFAINRADQDEPEEINNPDILRAIILGLGKMAGTLNTSGGELAWTPQFVENWVNNESTKLEEKIISIIKDKFEPIAKLAEDEKDAKLGQYLLKKNSTIDNSGGYSLNINTGYVRWDLLAFLINELVISDPGSNTLQQKNPPVKIVQHYFRNDPNNGDDKIGELLQYTKFRGAKANEFIDLSCDPGICLLPHSFFDERLQKTIDPDQTLGAAGAIAEGIADAAEAITTRLLNLVSAAVNSDVDLIGGETSTLDAEISKRYIGGIYLNTDMLFEAYDASIKNNKNADLGDFIKAVWEDRVNDACPLHNFIFQINPERSNECYIIDLPTEGNDLAKISKEIFEIEVQSNKSVVREYDLQATIPDALKSTVAVHAQNPDTTEDLDDLTFQAFNKAIENRLFISTDDTDSSTDDTDERSDDTKAEDTRLGVDSRTIKGKIQKRYLLALEKFLKLAALYFEIINVLENDSIDNSDSKINDLKTTLKELQTTSLQMVEHEHKYLNNSAVIPLEFSMTLDGISNIVIGSVFKIREDRLPRAYRPSNDSNFKGANVGFIVFNEEQTITAGQDWTTKIGGKMILLPNDNVGKDTDVKEPEYFKEIGKIEETPPNSSQGGSVNEASSDITVTPTAEERARIILTFLKDNGYTIGAALGIIGNMASEAGKELDPAAGEKGTGGNGIGLIQWSNSRHYELKDAANEQGVPWEDINFQLNYFINEKPTFQAKLKTIEDYKRAAEYFWGKDLKPNSFIAYAMASGTTDPFGDSYYSVNTEKAKKYFRGTPKNADPNTAAGLQAYKAEFDASINKRINRANAFIPIANEIYGFNQQIDSGLDAAANIDNLVSNAVSEAIAAQIESANTNTGNPIGLDEPNEDPGLDAAANIN